MHTWVTIFGKLCTKFKALTHFYSSVFVSFVRLYARCFRVTADKNHFSRLTSIFNTLEMYKSRVIFQVTIFNMCFPFLYFHRISHGNNVFCHTLTRAFEMISSSGASELDHITVIDCLHSDHRSSSCAHWQTTKCQFGSAAVDATLEPSHGSSLQQFLELYESQVEIHTSKTDYFSSGGFTIF